ncbi:MAG: transglutaminase domain-containing protein [Candidatus Dojkabacteria bacterium]|jgi:hypothetical protein
MRNLSGYLKRILSLISLFVPFFFISITPLLAQEDEFYVNSYFVHTIKEDKVNTTLTLQLTTDRTRVLSIYTTSLQVKNINPKCYINGTEEIKCDRYIRTSVTDIQFDLKNRVITPESPFEITIVYTTPNTNEIAYNLQSKVLDATTKEVIVKYPKEKGEFSWASENIQNKELENNLYKVTFKEPKNPEVYIFFSNGIQYKFTVNRVFTNTTDQIQTFELILPMDSEFQAIIWEEISPLPTSSITDDDGNYIFSYMVEPNKTLDCHITGFIQKEVNSHNTQPKEVLTKKIGYWEMIDTVEIQRVLNFMKDKGLVINENAKDITLLKEKEKEIFYKYLYQYVIYRLDYNDDIKLGQIESTRSSISSIIRNSTSLTPVNFADFYIALLRYFSIPSRMVLGYVSNISGYTTDGFYHYWVEYYDITKSEWVSVDPFMEKYRKQNLFNNELADHIAILRRGKNPMSPTLTFYTPNDFLVELDNKDFKERSLLVKTNLSMDDYDITKKYIRADIDILNNGNIAISSIKLDKSNLRKISQYIDSVNNTTSKLLLPKQNHNIQLNIPFEKMNSNKLFITGSVSNLTGISENITMKLDLPNSTPKYITILSKILSLIFFSVVLLLSYLLFKTIKKLKCKQQV